MLPLPKRPGPYIIALLLAVLIILAAWLHHLLNSPELRETIRQKNHLRHDSGVAPRD